MFCLVKKGSRVSSHTARRKIRRTPKRAFITLNKVISIPLSVVESIFTPTPKQYETHVPTSGFQKMLLSAGSAVLALNNPERADMVATLGETTGSIALYQIKQKMEAHPDGSKILAEKPRINTSTVKPEWLATLPEDSFGKAYYNFMTKRGFVADERPTVHFVDDPELAYIMTRYRESHDFWHVLTGLDTTVVDELGLKVFEYLQTGLPMCALSAVGGPLKLDISDKIRFYSVYVPWARALNAKTPFLMNVYWEKCLEDPLDFVREMYGFKAVPLPTSPSPYSTPYSFSSSPSSSTPSSPSPYSTPSSPAYTFFSAQVSSDTINVVAAGTVPPQQL